MNTESDSSDIESSSTGSSVQRVKSKKYKTKEIVKEATKKEFIEQTGKQIGNAEKSVRKNLLRTLSLTDQIDRHHSTKN